MKTSSGAFYFINKIEQLAPFGAASNIDFSKNLFGYIWEKVTVKKFPKFKKAKITYVGLDSKGTVEAVFINWSQNSCHWYNANMIDKKDITTDTYNGIHLGYKYQQRQKKMDEYSAGN